MTGSSQWRTVGQHACAIQQSTRRGHGAISTYKQQSTNTSLDEAAVGDDDSLHRHITSLGGVVLNLLD